MRCLHVAVLFATTVFMAASHDAQAGCALGPQIIAAPPAGAKLPPNPVLLVWLRLYSLYDKKEFDELSIVDGSGAPVPFTREEVKTEHNVLLYRLKVTAQDSEIVLVGRAGIEKIEASYTVAKAKPSAVPPGTKSHKGHFHLNLGVDDRPPTLLTEATYTYATGCPSSNGFMLRISPKAPAYRVEREHKTVWVVPDVSSSYSDNATTGLVVTGLVDCHEFSIPTDAPLGLEITPLYPDGSEGQPYWPGCERKGNSMTCHMGSTLSFTGPVDVPGKARPSPPAGK